MNEHDRHRYLLRDRERALRRKKNRHLLTSANISGRSARQRLVAGRDPERLEFLALSGGAFDQGAEVDVR